MVSVTVQRRGDDISSYLAWDDLPAGVAAVTNRSGVTTSSELIRWSGDVDFTGPAEPGRFRLLIREYKYRSANYVASEQSDAFAAQRG